MPLPAPNSDWPPPQWSDIYTAYDRWSAWYSGDADRLTHVYERDPQPQRVRQSQFSDGLVGRVSRWFWGTPPSPAQRSTKLHVPAAADIAGTSADLLYADMPTVTVDDSATQTRLDELLDDGLLTTLVEAAEVAAALGGCFLRVGWDRSVLGDRPLVDVVHPDSAVPTFYRGYLTEVTFHQVLADDKNGVLRHLERHVPGGVEHALYLGTSSNLGRPVPLTEHPATADIAEQLADSNLVETGIDTLDVVYKPNVLPNRMWRNHPVGSALGRSDYSGVEHLMDALDETYTAWMRDIRLAKGRIVVPQHYLESQGPGQGAVADLDREVFTPVNRPPDASGASEITASQFAIRHEEHSATARELHQQIVQGAGYSAQTFGLTSEVAMTATESNARERKTLLTRGKKSRLDGMALARLIEVLLAVDRTQFGSTVQPQPPAIEYPPVVTAQPSERAETARLLSQAEAASTYTLVSMNHPEWDESEIAEEVDRIQSERGAAMPEPGESLGQLAAGQPPTDEE
ncbi:hypothetical protein [Actinopolyspora halophila]|uniref:hypothetical protein n=1 Tax=Actinopolyspora halophila TaxID=1850 RepID=UPI00036B0623|nr:hypothetical protein [Actinopolyspora halophila]